MNDFKVGDRVEYVGGSRQGRGKFFTIAKLFSNRADLVENPTFHPLIMNLRLVTPAPDVLTIPRAELPEVVERDGFLCSEGFEYGVFGGAAEHRKRALAQLAVSEFLAAREKAEQHAADQHAAILNKRRDELAVEVAKAAGFIDFLDFTYKEHLPSAQAAINMLIERDGKGGK